MLVWFALTLFAAPDVKQRFDRAQELYDNAEYARAETQLTELLREPQLQRELALTARLLLGSAQLVLRGAASARGTFAELLAIDPLFALPRTTPPKIAAVFEDVRSALLLAPRARAPAIERGPRGLVLRVVLENVPAQADARVRYAAPGSAVFGAALLSADGPAYSAQLANVLTTSVALYIEITRDDKAVAILGSSREPLVLAVPPVEVVDAVPATMPVSVPAALVAPTPVTARPWFWIALGVGLVVAGGAVALGVGLSQQPGRLLLELEYAR